jgi:8-oxo-dGTP pyrophosphatase MutT (NUDIX family)
MDSNSITLSNIIDCEFTETEQKNNYNRFFDDKKKNYCSNCGKYGHIYKRCKDPITSIGIINLCLNDHKLNAFFKNKYIVSNIMQRYKQNNYHLKYICMQKFNDKNTQNDIQSNINKYLDIVKSTIKFLMVRRKNSVGYIEFVRGRYDHSDNNAILYLFNQMTYEEIDFLKNTRFEYIWNELWNDKYNDLPIDEDTIKNLDSYNETLFQINLDKLSSKDRYIYTKVHLKEYAIAKTKYDYIMQNNIFCKLADKINILYDQPEWGFPKGRRNLHEKNFDCAIREFTEETGIDCSHIDILDRIYPLNETLKGTNNLDYKHSYYLSISNMENVNLSLPSQKIEIGAIGWFTYDEAIKIIRPYHTNRLKLLEDVMVFLAYNLRYYASFNKTFSV